MTTNLPAEWKSRLSHLPTSDVSRIERLVASNQTAPLPQEKEVGPFLLFVLGDSVEEVASKTGTPKDVMYLTYLKYNWEEKRDELNKHGQVAVISALQKQAINYLLVATNLSITRQVAQVMSGALPPEKCPLIPRSLHGLKLLLELAKEVNNMSPEKAPNTTNVIHAQNVQVNQQLPAATEAEQSPEDRLASLLAVREKNG